MRKKAKEKTIVALLEKAEVKRYEMGGYRALFGDDKPLAAYLAPEEREKLTNLTRDVIKK